VLLMGGDKTGNEQWYETSVPLADRLYERHLIELVKTMAKARNFSELRNRLPAESRARVEARVKVTLHDMALDELRTARELTQERLGETLGIKQATVSKIERQSDMYVSTLTKFIEAMGGTLEIRACFPEGSVRIKQFSEARSRNAG
jgi:DNA-binding XRE family transcriptional regulator